MLRQAQHERLVFRVYNYGLLSNFVVGKGMLEASAFPHFLLAFYRRFGDALGSPAFLSAASKRLVKSVKREVCRTSAS